MAVTRVGTIGSRIREIRLELRLDQPTVAQRAGIPKNTLSAIETGRVSDPRTSTIVAIAQALGVSVLALLDEEEFEKTIQAIQQWRLRRLRRKDDEEFGDDDFSSVAMIEAAAR